MQQGQQPSPATSRSRKKRSARQRRQRRLSAIVSSSISTGVQCNLFSSALGGEDLVSVLKRFAHLVSHGLIPSAFDVFSSHVLKSARLAYPPAGSHLVRTASVSACSADFIPPHMYFLDDSDFSWLSPRSFLDFGSAWPPSAKSLFDADEDPHAFFYDIPPMPEFYDVVNDPSRYDAIRRAVEQHGLLTHSDRLIVNGICQVCGSHSSPPIISRPCSPELSAAAQCIDLEPDVDELARQLVGNWFFDKEEGDYVCSY